ncbi:MAG: universal stress protein [Candidatus Tectomicrobia bacterium]|nr:universal stress protein [Candidatus Tectomicrobia bacterium]
MYNTILLAVELQHWKRYSAHAMAARDVAITLARGNADTLHVLSVYTYHRAPTPTLLAARGADRQDALSWQTDDLMHQKIEAYTAPLKQEAFDVHIILRAGKPRDVILQAARNLRADLLVVGTHSHRGVIDVALGGTARQLSRDAPCPVVLVSPQIETQRNGLNRMDRKPCRNTG